MSYRKFIAQDILIAADGMPLIENGDLVVSASDNQHIDLIVISNKGDFRFQPLVGCNLNEFINAAGANMQLLLQQRINAQLANDGYEIENLNVSQSATGELNINLKAERVE